MVRVLFSLFKTLINHNKFNIYEFIVIIYLVRFRYQYLHKTMRLTHETIFRIHRLSIEQKMYRLVPYIDLCGWFGWELNHCHGKDKR